MVEIHIEFFGTHTSHRILFLCYKKSMIPKLVGHMAIMGPIWAISTTGVRPFRVRSGMEQLNISIIGGRRRWRNRFTASWHVYDVIADIIN